MPRRASAIIGIAMLWLSLAGACGGSTPTSPSGTSCGPLPASNSATLNTGDMFRVRFRVPSGRNPDVMFSIIGLADGPTAWRASFRLHDGATQLGVQDDIHDAAVFFKSPDSPFGTPASPYALSGPATAIAFTSISAGTIDGRLEFAVTSGPVFLSQLDLGFIELWQPRQGGGMETTLAVITSREICR